MKRWNIVAVALVASDLADATAYYQGVGLERQFLAQVRALMERIAGNPRKYQTIHGKIRRALLAKFPYAVYFVVHPDHVLVLAIIGANRDPALWQQLAERRL